jgi:uncharacterized protein YdeI (YjbR/CyaY-like superfamily)
MEEQLLFTDRQKFRQWLYKNHNTSKGVWLIFGKADKLKTVKPDEALEEALCFGWIDGLVKSVDNSKYLKKFTRRRKGSKWSEKNKSLANKLVANSRMTEYGKKAIEEAKKSGMWNKPKAEPISGSQMEILIKALDGFEPALSNFLNMAPFARRTYSALYLDAKQEETRTRRLKKIIERLNENKKPI